jgi:hypothetical protein
MSLHPAAEVVDVVDEYFEVLLSVTFQEMSPVICKYSVGSARVLTISDKTCAEVF